MKKENAMERMREFDDFLRQYEGVAVPNLDAFNREMIEHQEKIKEYKSLPLEERQKMCTYMISHRKNFQELLQICILSVLAYFLEGGVYVEEMLHLVRNSIFLCEENKYFIYGQIISYDFRVKNYLGEEAAWENRMLYRDIYQGYKESLGIERDIVPVEKRNNRAVVFFISQFLNEAHGPTKTILDRCEVMAQQMGAECVIINTGEFCLRAGYIPFFAPYFANYAPALCDIERVAYRGREYPFMQCSDRMPNAVELARVVERVREINPYCIFMIGGGSICADLCSNYYPLITVATVPSGIGVTEGQFLLKGKPVTAADREYVHRLGYSPEYLQYCPFTWSMNPQRGHFSREEFGIPQDAFTMLIVGARLDDEVTEEFIGQVLLPALEGGAFAVFMGTFDGYSQKCAQYPLLGECSVYVGFIGDVLAVNEICDIYVNPRRRGGGGSVVEAMAKSLVPVTLDYGDVALGAGEEFCVSDYDHMVQRILRLKDDAAYYQSMADKAYQRMKVVTDSAGIFWECFEKIRKLPQFQ
jgi:glycosyltransferase involved in cell wall biosynthesis